MSADCCVRRSCAVHSVAAAAAAAAAFAASAFAATTATTSMCADPDHNLKPPSDSTAPLTMYMVSSPCAVSSLPPYAVLTKVAT